MYDYQQENIQEFESYIDDYFTNLKFKNKLNLLTKQVFDEII